MNNQTSAADTAADNTTGAAIEAHITGNTDKAAGLFKQAEAAHQRAAPSESGIDPAWRDGVPLAPMPDAPAVTNETDAAVSKLNDMGGAHADLVASWGNDAPVNLQYARSAFQEMAAADPDLIAAVDRSGIGNSPAVLEHLARFGRLSAGLLNDNTIARRNNVTHSPIASKPRTGSSAQNELADLLDKNPPGSTAYKSKAVQQRVETLSRMIAGSGTIVGQGGRNA